MCQNGAAFPDITYSFYKVLAEIHEVNYKLIPLQNFKIVPENYFNLNRTIFIANPNAPTGLFLNLNEIEKILIHNPNNLIVIDEAYIDFGAESAIKLIEKFENILIVRTFSKSRSLAGARLGFCVGNENLINDLRNIKNLFWNPEHKSPNYLTRYKLFRGCCIFQINFFGCILHRPAQQAQQFES